MVSPKGEMQHDERVFFARVELDNPMERFAREWKDAGK